MGTEKNEQQTSAVLELLPAHLTYAAVVDERDIEHEISDLMIRRACAEMEAEQQFPFAPKSLSGGSR